MSASNALPEIHARLRAADRALALAVGGSSELSLVREATGALLVALHELVDLWEKHLLSAGGLDVSGPPAAPSRRKRRSAK